MFDGERKIMGLVLGFDLQECEDLTWRCFLEGIKRLPNRNLI